MTEIYRHGDVLLEKTDADLSGAKETGPVLAEGEATGHKHRIAGAKVVSKGGKKFVKVKRKASLTHEEHKPIQLEKGNYAVSRQREYNPSENRQVRD